MVKSKKKGFNARELGYPSLLLNEKELDINLLALSSILEFEQSIYSSELQIQNIINVTMYAIIGQTIAHWAALLLDSDFEDNEEKLELVSLKGSITKKQLIRLINNKFFNKLKYIKHPVFVKELSADKLKENLIAMECELIIPIYDRKRLKCLLFLGQRYSNKKYKHVDIKFINLILLNMIFLIKYINLSATLADYNKQKDEIVKKKLAEAEKHLLRKNKFAILGELISSIMHEIKNPINSLYTITQVYKRRYKGDFKNIKIGELTELFRDMTDETEKLKYFFDNLVNFVIRNNKKIENVNLHNFVDHILSLTKKKIREKQIEIHNLIEKDVVVCFDKTQLHQLFLNLLLNSIEAISKKGIINLNTMIYKQDLIITIEDNGKGIEDNIKDKLFEPFFSTKKSGIGLGLAICYNIINDYEGSINIRSTKNEGTRVSIKFPNKLLHGK